VLYRSYAKVNLTLEILSRREDGFHELASLVHTVSLADDLRIEASDELLTRVEGLVIDPETNLVARAAELLATRGGERRGAELSLVKRIPAAAGLGGGSSDAATTLVALNSFWDSRLHLSQLEQLAAELGSDIPFFIRGGAALMRGRGEELEPMPPLKHQWLILLVPPHDVIDKTRQLYGLLDLGDFTSGERTAQAAKRFQRAEPLVEDEMLNGFERAARTIFPGLSKVWAEAQTTCDRRFFLSGAGPALFALAPNQEDARRQVTRLTRLAPGYAVRTVKHARASLRFARAPAIGYP
jgi:4-diphosphocytidyl-2-C-methyl-D-erythritol kinase